MKGTDTALTAQKGPRGLPPAQILSRDKNRSINSGVASPTTFCLLEWLATVCPRQILTTEMKIFGGQTGYRRWGCPCSSCSGHSRYGQRTVPVTMVGFVARDKVADMTYSLQLGSLGVGGQPYKELIQCMEPCTHNSGVCSCRRLHMCSRTSPCISLLVDMCV